MATTLRFDGCVCPGKTSRSRSDARGCSLRWNLSPSTYPLPCGGSVTEPPPHFVRARARRRGWMMTNPPTSPEQLPLLHARPPMTAGTPNGSPPRSRQNSPPPPGETYESAWRQWARWCHGRGISPLPAPPESAEAGLHFSTLDCYCSGIAHRHHQEGLTDPTADVLVRRVRRELRRILGFWGLASPTIETVRSSSGRSATGALLA
jgi:hypothetical protein